VLISVGTGIQAWRHFIAFFLVICLMSELLDIIIVAKHRQQIGQYIDEHRQEIELVV